MLACKFKENLSFFVIKFHYELKPNLIFLNYETLIFYKNSHKYKHYIINDK